MYGHKQNKLSHNCLSQELCKRVWSCVLSCVWSCVLSTVLYPCHMSGRATRNCKETVQQVKQRLTREQANRTKKRQKELLDLRESDSESDSGDEEDNSSEEESDSLSRLRRDLYLGLLCLFTLIVLLAHWVFSTSLRR